ncbi:MAG TPA: DUF4394 domain-containing protein [Kofleriaceae bacterium]|nr:DUF4394 domain-containing protein [Kofleriaceae bacterium]
MTIRSRRWTPAAFLFFYAVCACGDIEAPGAGAGDPGGPDAGSGGVGGGPDAPDGGLGEPGWPEPPEPPPGAEAYAPLYLVSEANELILVGAEAPSTVLSSVPISGLVAGEDVLAIDFRPATGALYALSSGSRVYTIDPASGAATAVGAAPFSPALRGSVFGFDFNPTVDRIRVVSDAGQNLRLHPVTGEVAGTDTDLAFDALDPAAGAAASVVASAYTGNFLGSTRTTLYGIDTARDSLVRQGSDGGAPTSPNTGALFSVGPLGFDAAELAGFDIAGRDAAFAAVAPAGTSPQLHVVNLATGAATALGPLGDGRAIRGLAAPTQAPPMVYAVTESNKLIGFRADQPGNIVGWVPLTGLDGDAVLGIDFRPATGELYALGSSRLFRIDIASGAATPVGGPLSLAGAAFGFDFNPTVDRIRVVSDARQNLRLDPVSGAVAGADIVLTYAIVDPAAGNPPRVSGSAYTASFLGSTRTTLYGIDTAMDSLVRQGSDGGAPTSPNSGALFTVGPLGLDAASLVGFDIAARDAAFAALVAEGASEAGLYIINLGTGAATSLGAIGGGETVRGIAIPPPAPPTVFAVTESNQLLSLSASTPGALIDSVGLTGLAAGEKVLGIDFRPATGELYALGSSQLYRLDAATGAATPIGPPLALGGKELGFDFNPTVDRIRVVSGRGQNLRLHPVTGAVAGLDTDLAYDAADPGAGSPPRAVGAAYTNSFLGSTRTTLYDIDAERDVLVMQGSDGGAPVSPNTGTLFTVGALGVNASELAGIDIAATGAAFAVLVPAGDSAARLYVVNLATGALVSLGALPGADPIAAAAVTP